MVMAVSGYAWLSHMNSILGIPALLLYGFSIAGMFALVHECTHRTAFANNGVAESRYGG